MQHISFATCYTIFDVLRIGFSLVYFSWKCIIFHFRRIWFCRIDLNCRKLHFYLVLMFENLKFNWKLSWTSSNWVVAYYFIWTQSPCTDTIPIETLQSSTISHILYRTQFTKVISFLSYTLHCVCESSQLKNEFEKKNNNYTAAVALYLPLCTHTKIIYICIAFYIDTAVEVRNGYSSPRHLAHPTIDPR